MSYESQQVHQNAGWCWFQDPRVLTDRCSGAILFTSVANYSGRDGGKVDANIDVTSWQPSSGSRTTTTLGNIPTHNRGDDHNTAALWQRPDGRYLAVYTGHCYGMGWNGSPHGSDEFPDTFYRISAEPHCTKVWLPEQTFRWPCKDLVGDGRNGVTYSNLHHLQKEGGEKGRLYNIARASGQIWQIATSDDWGESWTYRGCLSTPPAGGRAYSNGYVKFSSNGEDRIDFIMTEAHPRDYNNGLYHGYIQNGQTFDNHGALVDPETFATAAPQPEAFTKIFSPGEIASTSRHSAWPVELGRTKEGKLTALFLSRYGNRSGPLHKTRQPPGSADHRLYFATNEGGHWQYQEIAQMGPGLLDTEEDYTGLGTIDLTHGRRIYVSTPIDPRNGAQLTHHEIFCGECNPGEQTNHIWEWHPITFASSSDNLRPLIQKIDSKSSALLWMSGRYDHQTDYATTMQATIIESIS